MTSSLQASDAAAAAHAVAPRVALADIENAISAEYFTTAYNALGSDVPRLEALKMLTLCILVMTNGFVVIGKSAPASPENFNAELGQKFAKDDAMRQLWPLMGYALKDRLAAA